PRRLVGRLQRAAAELDPAAVVKRRRRAEADRHVSLRPAPETMTTLTALLPLKAGVAVHATLDRAARAAKAGGDPRSIGQLMADILIDRILHPGAGTTSGGQAETTWANAAAPPAAAAAVPAGTASAVPVLVNLVVRDSVLLGDEDGTGWVDGYGPVPGELIRGWVADNLETGLEAWVRRVYEQPTTGRLVGMDSTAVLFQGRLAEFIRVRDQVCRTPGCDAPIRHTDHVEARARGGPTTEDNGQGLCELCNYAKQADGWTARTVPGPTHTVATTTPTGHTYTSTAEPL
ncbi:MAG TPA: HNH endonuclease signature motif containing protein, partial [Actinoplanes sp.]|nr:HNH endonuclease signature motif containing protein [Actinoplanes sp.]